MISIRFFNIENEAPNLIFRAEYSDSNSSHCQPHWHFHPFPTLMTSNEYNSFDDFDESRKDEGFELDKTKGKLNGMHYMMAFSINSSKLQHSTKLATNSLNWIKMIIENIYDEFDYCFS